MIFAVWIPLLMPLLAVPAARRAAEWLPPARRPGRWRAFPWSSPDPARPHSASSPPPGRCGCLPWPHSGICRHRSSATTPRRSFPRRSSPRSRWRRARSRWSVRDCGSGELRAARAGSAATDELSVRPDELPYAYALPGRPDRIVVTTGMLRALDAREREVLFAHERAHLAGRHHLFLATAELTVTLHPMLRGLREPLAYALERWADESAATATGDRALTARAIGRAALAAAHVPGPGHGPVRRSPSQPVRYRAASPPC